MKKLALITFVFAFATTAFADFSRDHVIGKWLLNGTNKSTYWTFDKNDTFAFKGTDSSSKGKWSTDGTYVKVVWTHIDGKKVKEGTVKAKYKLNEDGSFNVLKYVYRKQ